MKRAIMIMGSVILALLIFSISVQCNYNALVKKNENLQLSFDTLNGTNSSLRSKQSELEDEISKLKEYNSALSKDKQKLQSDFDELSKNSTEWLALSQTEKDAAKAKAEADKTNAEAEKIEAEIRLKTAYEQSSQIEAEEQRRATEGTTIYEDNYVIINYLGFGKGARYPFGDRQCLILIIENKTTATLDISASSIALDGYDVGKLACYDSVSPRSKGKAFFLKMNDSSKYFENTSPSKISGSISVKDANDIGIFGSSSWYTVSFVDKKI